MNHVRRISIGSYKSRDAQVRESRRAPARLFLQAAHHIVAFAFVASKRSTSAADVRDKPFA